jgi:hypothetical protein
MRLMAEKDASYEMASAAPGASGENPAVGVIL